MKKTRKETRLELWTLLLNAGRNALVGNKEEFEKIQVEIEKRAAYAGLCRHINLSEYQRGQNLLNKFRSYMPKFA